MVGLLKRLEFLRSPVLIVGFSHSGTRLVSQLLDEMGVFQVGSERTHEWEKIQRIDDEILPKWYVPDEVRNFAKRDTFVSVPKMSIFKGLFWRGYRAGGLWGAKDPRMCATLPSWLATFPDCVIVHVVRDPMDTVVTLGPKYANFTPGGRMPQEDLAFWADLWIASDETVNKFGRKGAGFFQVRFEDVCRQPQETLQPIADSLKLSPSWDSLGLERIKSGKIGVWKEWLKDGLVDSEQTDKVEELLGPVRREYGYLPQ